MDSLAHVALLLFWLGMAVAFCAMSGLSYRTRRRMPRMIKEATDAAVFQGPDLGKLRPIFDEMLALEFLALLLTFAAALAEWLTLAGVP